MPRKTVAITIFFAALYLVACSTDSSNTTANQDGISSSGTDSTSSEGDALSTSGSDSSTSGAGDVSTSGSDSSTSGSEDTSSTSGVDSTADAEDTSIPTETPLIDRVEVSEVTVPEGVKAGVSNWRVWGRGSLNVAPVFSVPMANCGTLVCFTTEGAGGQTARVARLDASDTLVQTFDLGTGVECRGLAAEADGHFAALLWDGDADRIYVHRYDVQGQETWSTELVNNDNKPDDFGIGDSRLEYGDGKYGAYYHVHSNDGHEGDTLKWVDAVSGAESTGWGWGCSHSMSALLSYHPDVNKFMPACVTDCFPGTSGDFATQSRGGIYLNHRTRVMDMNAGCNGSVAGELGGAALSPDGWAITFNAHQAPVVLGQNSYDPSSMNQDIGLALINGDYSTKSIVWLTNSSDINEADASIARWRPTSGAEQYLVGWNEAGVYRLGRVSGSGEWLEGPVDVSAVARWGRRDDPFRRHTNNDVIWSWFDGPASTTLKVARVRSEDDATCADF